MWKNTFFVLFFFSFLFAQETKRKPDYFMPYYTGSLLSSDGKNIPLGVFIVQPLLFYSVNYGNYKKNFSLKTEQATHILNPVVYAQMGIAPYVDFYLTLQGFYKTRGQDSDWNWGDTSVLLGFQIYQNETLPLYARFTVAEILPSGKSNRSTFKHGINLTSTGSYQTQFGLDVTSYIDKTGKHPIRWRANVAYTYPHSVHVHGVSVFGEDAFTRAKVKPGNYLYFLFSPEIAITQHWIVTCDMTYQHNFKGSFSSSTHNILNIGTSDQFTLAPAIEYGFNPNLGIIAGSWFSVTGKRATAFASAAFSFYYAF